MTNLEDLKGMTVAAIFVELEKADADLTERRLRRAQLKRVAAKLKQMGVAIDSSQTVADAILAGTFADRPRKRRAKRKPAPVEKEAA